MLFARLYGARMSILSPQTAAAGEIAKPTATPCQSGVAHSAEEPRTLPDLRRTRHGGLVKEHVEEGQFIDGADLLRRIPVSRRTLYHWRTTGQIPFIRLSGRRLLYHWPTVLATLLRAQQNGTN